MGDCRRLRYGSSKDIGRLIDVHAICNQRLGLERLRQIVFRNQIETEQSLTNWLFLDQPQFERVHEVFLFEQTGHDEQLTEAYPWPERQLELTNFLQRLLERNLPFFSGDQSLDCLVAIDSLFADQNLGAQSR